MATNSGQDRQGYPTLDIKAARALNPHIRTIQIQSILGGMSPTTHFATPDQYGLSYAIDPSIPITTVQTKASGLIAPAGVQASSMIDAMTNSGPMWILDEPKKGKTYAYNSDGTYYTWGSSANGWVEKVGTLSASTGNGAAYYDNYIYMSTNTTVARYGPLDGAAAITTDYWGTTLGKSYLTNSTYPNNYGGLFNFPNHVMHRHSDGKLYVADVVGNQGTIHVISTTKTTVEGDTDNNSTANKLQFGYGLWPTALETYGSSLAIALIEFDGINTGAPSVTMRSARAKLAIWDTISQSFNSITWAEFPDSIITALKNVNGVLYIVSTNYYSLGFRLTRYVGGSSFEEVAYIEDGIAPPAGAVDASAKRLLFGSSAGGTTPVVYSYGLQKQALGQGLHIVMRGVNASNQTINNIGNISFSAVHLSSFFFPLYQDRPLAGLSTAGGGTICIPTQVTGGVSTATAVFNSVFNSQMYRIGRPFKITKIRIPLAQAVAANMSVTPSIVLDDATTTTALTAIDNTSYPGALDVVYRLGISGRHNFYLNLVWGGSVQCIVGLPITIEYEFTDDN